MSLHTILSQMDKEFDKEFVIRTGTKKIKRVGYYCTKDSDSHVGHDPKLILEFFHSFATRIVEEVGKEVTNQVKLFIKDQAEHEVSEEHTLELMPSLLEHVFDNLNKK